MNTLVCIPTYLYPSEQVRFSRCTVVPGIKIIRLSGALQEAIRVSSENLPVQPEFVATHAICIYKEEYLNSLLIRLRLEKQEPKIIDSLLIRLRLEKQEPKIIDSLLIRLRPEKQEPKIIDFIDTESLAKQAVLSLIFAGRASFAFRGAHSFKVSVKGRRKTYRATGYGHGPLYRMSDLMNRALLYQTWRHIEPRKVAQFGNKLDRYFREGIWWTDRLGMAISYFWSALCTPFPEQSFLSLTTALESLLSTQTMEITHILAERCAILVTRNPSNKLEIYKTVKDLYKTRSKLVHGKSFPKKGIQTDRLFVTAKRVSIPISSLESIVDLTISVIMSVFSNKDLLQIIQTKKSEEKVRQELNEYFAKILFND